MNVEGKNNSSTPGTPSDGTRRLLFTHNGAPGAHCVNRLIH
jgi:hypothetical protein